MSDPPLGRAFGADNRLRLLGRYFAEVGGVTPANAWEHAYRLLLWINRKIGLAHCYENDKCQPGRPWYARSLAFHDCAVQALKTNPARLTDEVDLLFRLAAADLAANAAARRAEAAQAAARQRAPLRGPRLPRTRRGS